MKSISLSKSDAKKLLRTIQKNKSEAPNLDAKLDLNLKEAGDRAVFIKHIAALANTGQRSFMFIGIEDKTWFPKGIPEGSSLLETDSTQQQMNQILQSKIDPQIAVSYRVHEIDGFQIGVIGLEGEKPPYIVSLEEMRFGGKKNKGEDFFINNGAIFIRRGTDSILANRQSQILSLLYDRIDYFGLATSLVFIALLIAIGIGVGSSLIKFQYPSYGFGAGCIWGIVVGWYLNNRLAEKLGGLSTGQSFRFVKNIVGILWGGTIGGYFGYAIINSILLGKMKVLDPLSMSMAVSIAIVIIVIICLLIAFIEYKVLQFFLGRKYV